MYIQQIFKSLFTVDFPLEKREPLGWVQAQYPGLSLALRNHGPTNSRHPLLLAEIPLRVSRDPSCKRRGFCTATAAFRAQKSRKDGSYTTKHVLQLRVLRCGERGFRFCRLTILF